MPPSLREERRAGLERSGDVEVGRRPDRAANLVADQRRGRHRASEAVREATGDEADEPRRPGVVADEQGARPKVRGDERARRIDGLLRQLPATFVHGLELDRQLFCADRILLEHQGDGQLGIGDPTRGVDAGHDSEGEIAGGRLRRHVAAARQERAKARVRGRGQLLQAEPDDRAALAGHRCHVRDRPDGRHGRQPVGRHAVPVEQRGGELV